MPRVAIDIDDTLYPFCDLARKLIADEGFRTDDKRLIAAAYAPWPEWRTPLDLLGEDKWVDIIAKCHDNDLIASQRPYEGAVDTLRDLSDHGHELLYISARGRETRWATSDWLEMNGFPGGDLVCTMEDKRPYIADCRYMIDDRPKTLVNFIFDADWNGPQRRAFALTKPFNMGLTDVSKIYLAPTWAGLRYYMIGKGLLPEVAHVGA